MGRHEYRLKALADDELLAGLSRRAFRGLMCAIWCVVCQRRRGSRSTSSVLRRRCQQAYERELTKERFALGGKPRRSRGVAPVPSASSASLPSPELSTLGPSSLDTQSTSNPNPTPKRHVPAAVARAVFQRDGRQCSYVAPDGRRCSARRCLELDHVDPWAVGGESTIENLRLRCRAHNQHYARQYFGKSRVEAVVQRARRRRAAAERAIADHPELSPDMGRRSGRGLGGDAARKA